MTNNRPPTAGLATEIEYRHPPGRPVQTDPVQVYEPGRGGHPPTCVDSFASWVARQTGHGPPPRGRALAVPLASHRDAGVGQDEEVSP